MIWKESKNATEILQDPTAKAPWSVIHPLSEGDSAAVAALRPVVAPMKGKLEGTAGRGPFNDIMERVAVPEGVTFEAATVRRISDFDSFEPTVAHQRSR